MSSNKISTILPPPAAVNSAGVEVDGKKFKELCLSNDEKEIKKIFDDMFNPDKDMDVSEKNINVLRSYLAGGLTYDEFKSEIKKFDNSIICGLVHKKGEMGYMCKTCENVNTMFLCMECFKMGNHEGHEYYLIRCEDGATCDCGLGELLKESGFCKNHGPSRDKAPDASNELTISFEVVFSYLIYRLVQELRISANFGDKVLNTYVTSLIGYKRFIEPYVDLLNDLCSTSTVTRKIVLNYLMDKEYYSKKITEDEERSKEKEKSYVHKEFVQKIDKMKILAYPSGFKKRFKRKNYETLFDELFFWAFEYLLPNPLCRFFENLLPDVLNDEKRCLKFVESFAYEYLHGALISTKTEEQLHQQIGCQLFNNPTIAKKAVEKCDIFQIFIVTFYNIFKDLKAIQRNNLQKNCKTKSPKSYHLNFRNAVLRKGIYFTEVVDLSYLLNHQENLKSFFEDEVLTTWLELVSYYQCVNTYQRQFGNHVEYENLVAYSAFLAEWEFCAVVVWSFIQHLKDEACLDLSMKAIEKTKAKLLIWLQSVSNTDHVTISRNLMSFHIPLHRYYSILLYNAIYRQHAAIDQVFNHDDITLKNLLAYPLHIHSVFHEIHANIWVKNGLQMKECVIYYTRNDFCRSYIDADLFLIQLVASRLDPEEFMKALFDKFYVNDFCRVGMRREDSIFDQYDESQQCQMMIAALILLAETVTVRPNLRLQDYDLTRQEVVDLACIGSFTHSELKKYVPSTYTWGSSMSRVDVDAIIREVCESHEPAFNDFTGEIKQTKYTAKGIVWETEYDPLFAFYRSIQLSEYQESLNRYTNYVKLKKLFDKPENVWPPFRLPNYLFEDKVLSNVLNLLHTRSLHAALFMLFHKRLNNERFSDKLTYFAVYILDLMIHTAKNGIIKSIQQQVDDARIDGNLDKWFPTNDIFNNMCIKIPSIVYESDGEVEEYIRYLFNKNADSENELKKLDINESIISILVKIVYKIGKTNEFFESYKLSGLYEPRKENESRIGDEYHFVTSILHKAANISEKCKLEIQSTLQSMEIDQVTEPTNPINTKTEDIKARHQRFMEKMLSKQVKFLSNYQFQESVDESIKTISNYNYPIQHECECCICRSKSQENVERPIGLLSLVRPTNILKFRESTKIDRKIPLSGASILDSDKCCANVEQTRIDLLKTTLDLNKCVFAINSVWNNNIFTQTCGHYVHFDCFFEYLKTKKQAPNDYNCPLCEQMANCLLPIQISSGQLQEENLDVEAVLTNIEAFNTYCNSYTTYSSIYDLLREDFVINTLSMRKIVPCISEVLNNLFKLPPYDTRILGSSENKNLSIPYYFLSNQDTVLFLISVLRNQIEIAYLVNEECNGIRRSYFHPLFQVLSFRMKVVCSETKVHLKKWLLLTSPSQLVKSATKDESVPILLSDATSIFLAIVLNCPNRLHRLSYQTIVNAYFNLVYIQSVVKMMLIFKIAKTDTYNTKFSKLSDYIAFIREKLGNDYFERSELDHDVHDEIEKSVESSCLFCLRIAAVLQSYLYGDSFQHDTFESLTEFLHIDYKKSISSSLLDWRGEDTSNVLEYWLDELKGFLAETKMDKTVSHKLFLLNNITYQLPSLIDLPYNYMDLYFHYTQTKCNYCIKIPSVTMICLLCGQSISICCDAMNSIDIAHAEKCAIGSRLYINIQTTNVVIIKRVDQKLKAGIWGTLYLDEHGEEDIELKRGRPLYLCMKRYNLLKLQWHSHIIEYKRLADV